MDATQVSTVSVLRTVSRTLHPPGARAAHHILMRSRHHSLSPKHKHQSDETADGMSVHTRCAPPSVAASATGIRTDTILTGAQRLQPIHHPSSQSPDDKPTRTGASKHKHVRIKRKHSNGIRNRGRLKDGGPTFMPVEVELHSDVGWLYRGQQCSRARLLRCCANGKCSSLPFRARSNVLLFLVACVKMCLP